MDIFTTVLTRVVPVPIKPTSLKVKALLKEAGASKLKEDLDHLENHDYYFGNKKKENEQDKNVDDEQAEPVHVESASENEEDRNGNDTGVTESEDGVKHLDLYV